MRGSIEEPARRHWLIDAKAHHGERRADTFGATRGRPHTVVECGHTRTAQPQTLAGAGGLGCPAG